MVEPDFLRFDTLSLHAGQRPDPTTGARAVPIYFTTSYSFPDTDEAAALFNLEAPGHIYSRISNPTVAVLEERIAALEGGVGAVCTASGTAALHLAVASLLSAGDHIVASKNLYGGSYNMMSLTLPRFGITTTFVDPRDPSAFEAAIEPNTKLFYGETLGNPGIEVMDVEAVADVAHANGLPLMVDSTFSTPYLFRPIEHGADIVIHSVTKFLGGHGTALGGVLVDGGRFDWSASRQVPDDDRAVRRLPRRGVRRGVRPVGARHAGPRRGPPRLRRLHEPAQRVRPAAGHRDAAAADGAPRRQHRSGARDAAGQRRGDAGSSTRGCRRTPTTSSPSGSTRRVPVRSSASG